MGKITKISSTSDLLTLGHFAKMKVAPVLHILSHKTAASLKYAVELYLLPQETLITVCSSVFQILNSRNKKTSITKQNIDQKLQVLTNFVFMLQQTKIGKNGCQFKLDLNNFYMVFQI